MCVVRVLNFTRGRSLMSETSILSQWATLEANSGTIFPILRSRRNPQLIGYPATFMSERSAAMRAAPSASVCSFTHPLCSRLCFADISRLGMWQGLSSNVCLSLQCAQGMAAAGTSQGRPGVEEVVEQKA